MSQITTEITSSQIPSDNPIHQRLLFAYEAARPYISGDVLEVGCGEGRGLEMLSPYCKSYTALDKNKSLLNILSNQYPTFNFIEANVPPFSGIHDNSFDCVIAFQVIEHIKDDHLFVKEIYRVLKPGGKALISTPNKTWTLTRNPWHEREYTSHELLDLVSIHFKTIDTKSIIGNKKVNDYYELNKKAVNKITRWDIFNLQNRLPSSVLRIPYDFLNRFNRNNMMNQEGALVSNISIQDYFLTSNPEQGYDLFYVLQK